MRHLKTTLLVVAALAVTALLGLAGCGDDHRDRFHDDRDRSSERYERRDSDRQEERQESDRREDRRRDSDDEHGDR